MTWARLDDTLHSHRKVRDGMAQIQSRAWFEWHMRRGRDPRRAREKIPATMRQAVIRRDGLVCQLCGESVDRTDVHIDHIKPAHHGGHTVEGNLQVAHKRCNLQKGARWDGH